MYKTINHTIFTSKDSKFNIKFYNTHKHYLITYMFFVNICHMQLTWAPAENLSERGIIKWNTKKYIKKSLFVPCKLQNINHYQLLLSLKNQVWSKYLVKSFIIILIRQS